MLRGSVVKVNNKDVKSGRNLIQLPKHLIGKTGIALERVKRGGYIRVLQHYQGWLTDLCYPEENLDIIEPPREL